MIEVRVLGEAAARQATHALACVLVDCIEGGASVSFMAGFPIAEAEAFYASVADGVERGERILIAAFDEGDLVGTVQVITAMPPNQPHRGDVSKLLVKRSARGKGIAAMLMARAEEVSREAGKSLLVLDTATGDTAERLYERLGWTRAGVIPRYAMYPDGRWCDTTIFWKQISR